MWGNIWGLCLGWGLAEAVPGRVVGCLCVGVGGVSACGCDKTKALWHLCASGAGVSEAQALDCISFNFFFCKAKGLKQPAAPVPHKALLQGVTCSLFLLCLWRRAGASSCPD